MSDRTVYTFSDLVSIVKTKIGINSTRLTNFAEGSNLLSIIEAACHFVEYLQLRVNKAIKAFSLKDAQGDDIDLRTQDWAVTRKPAKNATGIVTFYRSTPAPSQFTVFAGVQVSTTSDVFGNSLSYTLDNDVTFPSGAMSVSGYVTCTLPGIIGNCLAGQVAVKTSTISGVDTVSNLAAFTDGADRESDDALKKRVPEKINGLKAGCEAAIKAAALSVTGITVVRVVENEPALGQVSVYVSNESGTLSQTQLDAVKLAVETEAAFGIVSNVLTPDILYVSVSMDITYDDQYYTVAVIDSELRDQLFTFFMTNPDTTVKLWDLQLLIRNVPGVVNARNIKINGVADDYTTSGFKVIRLVDKQNPISINYRIDS